MKEYTAELVSIEEIGADTVKALFTKPEGFTFLPGQFVMIGFENKPKIKKAYSIAGTPDQEHIELCIKVHVQSDFSARLSHSEPGEKMLMQGPFGKFWVPLPLKRDTLFIATGTGIAPLMCMIKSALANCQHKISLAYGFRHEDSFLYKEDLDALAKEYPHFSFKTIVSQPGEGHTGERGYVQQLIEKYYNDGSGKDAYLCGAPAMIKEVTELVKEKGYTPFREMW